MSESISTVSSSASIWIIFESAARLYRDNLDFSLNGSSENISDCYCGLNKYKIVIE